MYGIFQQENTLFLACMIVTRIDHIQGLEYTLNLKEQIIVFSRFKIKLGITDTWGIFKHMQTKHTCKRIFQRKYQD